jgi:hypothetical protein
MPGNITHSHVFFQTQVTLDTKPIPSLCHAPQLAHVSFFQTQFIQDTKPTPNLCRAPQLAHVSFFEFRSYWTQNQHQAYATRLNSLMCLFPDSGHTGHKTNAKPMPHAPQLAHVSFSRLRSYWTQNQRQAYAARLN